MKLSPDAASIPETAQIKPYRLRSMMLTAGKIMDAMVKSDISVSYNEMRIILDMVRYSIDKGESSYDDKG